MKVYPFCINKGMTTEHYILMCVDSDGEEWVMNYAPNNWKTEKGALRYAAKRGLEIA